MVYCFNIKHSLFFFVLLLVLPKQITAETKYWSALAYIQADNNLAPYAEININDMETALKENSPINLLVQWDQPENNKTWRYHILPKQHIDAGSLDQEMGINPSQELIDAMSWVKDKFPANNYALFLWNHGSGVEDYSKKTRNLLHIPWLEETNRGILYDDTQETCLTNGGLATALTAIKTKLGKKLDVLGMDACMMAMLEIGYQVRNLATIFVASEEVEPGLGWPYSLFIAPLSENPAAFTPQVLAQYIVSTYGSFYKNDEPDTCMSGVYLDKLDAIKTNIDQVVALIATCKKASKTTVKKTVITARNKTQEFAVDSYIDLYSFYGQLLAQFAKLDTKKATPSLKKSLANLKTALTQGQQKIKAAVFANVAGKSIPSATGISIYYPKPRYSSAYIHPSYTKTAFAKGSKWLAFIKEYRG